MKIVRKTFSTALVLCAVFQSCTARLYNPFLPNFAVPATHLEKSHLIGPSGLTPRDLPPIPTNDLPISSLEMGPVSPRSQDLFPFTLPQPSDTRIHFNDIQPHKAGPQLIPFLPNDITPIQGHYPNPSFDLVHPDRLDRHFVPPQPIDVGSQFEASQPVDYYPLFNPFQGDYVGSHQTHYSHVPLSLNEFETTPIHHPVDVYEPSYNLHFDIGTPFSHPEADLRGFNGGNGYNDFNSFDNGPFESTSLMSPQYELDPFNPYEVPAPLVSPLPPFAFHNDHYSDPDFESNNDVSPWNREPTPFLFSTVNPSVPYPLAMQPIMDHMQPQTIHNSFPVVSQLKFMPPPHPMMNFAQPQMTPNFHPIMNHPDHPSEHPFHPMANNFPQPSVHPLLPVMAHPHPQSMQPTPPSPVHPKPPHTALFHPFHPAINHNESPILVPFH